MLKGKNQVKLLVKTKSKGQALIEFVIILPIFVFMILAVIDIGKILYFGNNLESKMDEVITFYEENKTYDEINNLIQLDDAKIEFQATNENNSYVEFRLIKKIAILTPGLNFILDNPYEVVAKRKILYEQ